MSDDYLDLKCRFADRYGLQISDLILAEKFAGCWLSDVNIQWGHLRRPLGEPVYVPLIRLEKGYLAETVNLDALIQEFIGTKNLFTDGQRMRMHRISDSIVLLSLERGLREAAVKLRRGLRRLDETDKLKRIKRIVEE